MQTSVLASGTRDAVVPGGSPLVRLLSSLLLLLITASAHSSPPSAQEEEIYASLMSWAVKFSGYPTPAAIPTVDYRPQAFFDENACNGKRCRVWGWYPNTGLDVVYVNESIRGLIADGSDPRSLLAASIIVHEFTHYLQAVHRGFAPYKCEEALTLEREAYSLQNAYIASFGRYLPVGVSMHRANCAGSASANSGPSVAADPQ
jgi:hypothetical protein